MMEESTPTQSPRTTDATVDADGLRLHDTAAFTASFGELQSPWKTVMASDPSRSHYKAVSMSKLDDMKSMATRVRTQSDADRSHRLFIKQKIRALHMYHVKVRYPPATESAAQLLDLYGFAVHDDVAETYREWYGAFSKEEGRRMAFYSKLVEEGAGLGLSTVIANDGIPAQYRGMLWSQLCSSSCDLVEMVLPDVACHPRVVEQIERDIPRSFPSLYRGRPELRQRLRSLLTLYARCKPEIGYTQGMSLIGVCVLIMVSKMDEALHIFSYLVERVCLNYFVPSMVGVKCDALILDTLLSTKLPRLCAHFAAVDLNVTLIVARVFIPLFANALPSETVFRVWDMLFVKGPCVLFQVMLAILSRFEDELLAQTCCVELSLHLDSLMASHLFDCTDLFALTARFSDVDAAYVALQRAFALRRLSQVSPSATPPPFALIEPPARASPKSAELEQLSLLSPVASSTASSAASAAASAPPDSAAVAPAADDGPPRFIAKSGAFVSGIVSMFRSSGSRLSLAEAAAVAAPASSDALPDVSAEAPPPSVDNTPAVSSGPVCEVCARRASDAEPLRAYRWSSLGESHVRHICATCFANSRCKVCSKTRVHVTTDGLCKECVMPTVATAQIGVQ